MRAIKKKNTATRPPSNLENNIAIQTIQKTILDERTPFEIRLQLFTADIFRHAPLAAEKIWERVVLSKNTPMISAVLSYYLKIALDISCAEKSLGLSVVKNSASWEAACILAKEGTWDSVQELLSSTQQIPPEFNYTPHIQNIFIEAAGKKNSTIYKQILTSANKILLTPENLLFAYRLEIPELNKTILSLLKERNMTLKDLFEKCEWR